MFMNNPYHLLKFKCEVTKKTGKWHQYYVNTRKLINGGRRSFLTGDFALLDHLSCQAGILYSTVPELSRFFLRNRFLNLSKSCLKNIPIPCV